jgi:hypothetical protein
MSVTIQLTNERTVSQTIAQLGVMLSFYTSLKTLLETDWSVFHSDHWYEHVKQQVNKFNDPSLDIDAAYKLFDKQYERCADCLSDFTPYNIPTIVPKKKRYSFLGMNSTVVTYKWSCPSCCIDRDMNLENKIAKLVEEEEERIALCV